MWRTCNSRADVSLSEIPSVREEGQMLPSSEVSPWEEWPLMYSKCSKGFVRGSVSRKTWGLFNQGQIKRSRGLHVDKVHTQGRAKLMLPSG